MPTDQLHPGRGRSPWGWVVLTAATLAAVLGARDYAGGWNDGSRLATVEALVDHHTIAIDDSIFVKVPPGEAAPYLDPGPRRSGTLDKLFINGRFYSDKSPVPALLMAVPYALLQGVTGWTAAAEPGKFCYLMTLLSSGLAYVVAVWCVYQLGRPLGLSPRVRLALTASFGLTTLAPVYARHVNNHALLLGVSAALMLGLACLARRQREGRPAWGWLLGVGTLAGLGYTIDLGVGPVLLLCAGGLVAWRFRRVRPILAFGLAALPWLALHHAVNHAVGGTWKPANAVPEYFNYPGSPFSAENLTGGWTHGGIGRFVVYLLALLFGKKGFLVHNLPLLLALPGLVVLLRKRVAETPELIFAVVWSAGVWLLYGAASNNYSGACYSVRWFVPLLAPGYFILAVLLREQPHRLVVFAILSAGGLLLAAWMWWNGPWTGRTAPPLWPATAASLLGWLWHERRLRNTMRTVPANPPVGEGVIRPAA